MAFLKDSRLSKKKKQKSCISTGCNCLVDPPLPPLNISFKAHFHFNVGFSVNYHPGPHLVSHAHSLARSAARVAQLHVRAASKQRPGGSSWWERLLHAVLKWPCYCHFLHHLHWSVCTCVRVCARGPHRLRHPGQRPQFVLGCHMPGSDGSAVDPAVAAHPALCEAGGTAGARDDRGRRRVRLKSAAG